jgi:hypothetical protein
MIAWAKSGFERLAEGSCHDEPRNGVRGVR